MGEIGLSATKHRNGYVAELKAASQYAKEGYDVYWPSFTQSSCDFIVAKGSDVKRVQVKSAYWLERPSGMRYLQCTVRKGCGGLNTRYQDYTREDCDEICIIGELNYWRFPVEELKGYKSLCLEKGQDIRKTTKGLNVTEYRYEYD